MFYFRNSVWGIGGRGVKDGIANTKSVAVVVDVVVVVVSGGFLRDCTFAVEFRCRSDDCRRPRRASLRVSNTVAGEWAGNAAQSEDIMILESWRGGGRGSERLAVEIDAKWFCVFAVLV